VKKIPKVFEIPKTVFWWKKIVTEFIESGRKWKVLLRWLRQYVGCRDWMSGCREKSNQSSVWWIWRCVVWEAFEGSIVWMYFYREICWTCWLSSCWKVTARSNKRKCWKCEMNIGILHRQWRLFLFLDFSCFNHWAWLRTVPPKVVATELGFHMRYSLLPKTRATI
jgi:hypothetical protein